MRACVTVIPLPLPEPRCSPYSVAAGPLPAALTATRRLPLPSGDELRDGHELGPYVFWNLRLGQALAGRAELRVRLVLGPAAATGGLDQRGPAGQVLLAEGLRPGQQLSQLGAFGGAAVQGGHHRQRLLPGPQVGLDRLCPSPR